MANEQAYLHFNQADLEKGTKQYEEALWQRARDILINSAPGRREMSESGRKMWEEANKEKIGQMAVMLGNSVAGLQKGKAQHLLTSASSIYLFQPGEFDVSYQEDKRMPYLMQKAKEAYQQFGKPLWDVLLGNVADANEYFSLKEGATLDYQAADFNAVQTYAQIKKGIDNITSHNGLVMMYDTETTGGRAIQTGATDAIHPQRITEFNFSLVNIGANGAADADLEAEQTFNSIIGTSAEEDQYLGGLIARYKKGEAIAPDEMVTLQRLALMGKSEVDDDASFTSKGIYRYSNFVGPEAVADMNPDDMEKGRQQLRNIGISQSNHLVDYSYDGKTVKVKGWEQQYLDAIKTVKEQGLTVAGHNIGPFDNPKMNTLVNSMSDDARAIANRILSGRGFDPENMVDTLAVVHNMIDMPKTAEHMLAKGTPEQKARAQSMINNMHENGFSSNKLEVLTPYVAPGFYEKQGAAHMANTDSLANAIVLRHEIQFLQGDKKDFLPSDSAEAYKKAPDIKIKGDSSQLFIAKNGADPNKYNLFGFMEDKFSGELRTFDGIRINLNNSSLTHKELFRQRGPMANVAYTVSSYKEMATSDKFRQAMKDYDPRMASPNLAAITITPVSDIKDAGETSIKAASPIHIVGFKEDVQRYIMDNFMHGGDKVNGRYTDETLTQEERAVLDRVIVQDGKVTHVDYNIEDAIDYSDYRLRNEGAARTSREFSLKKDEQALRYNRDREAFAEDTVKDKEFASDHDREAAKKDARKQFDEEVKKKSFAYEQKLRTGKLKKEEAKELAKGTWHEYFGYEAKSFPDQKDIEKMPDAYLGRRVIFSNTVDNQVNRLDYVENNRYLMEKAAEKARERANGDEALAAIYYKQYMTAAYSEAQERFGEHSEQAGFQNELGRYRSTINSFDIDMSEFKGVPTEKKGMPFRPWIKGEGGKLADSIARYLGHTNSEIGRMAPEQKKNLVTRLHDYMQGQGYFKGLSKDLLEEMQIKKEDDLASASRKTVTLIRSANTVNPDSALSQDTDMHQVIMSVDKNFGLSNEDVDAVLSRADQTIPEFQKMPKKEYGVKAKDDKKYQAALRQKATDIVDKVLFQNVSREDLEKRNFTKEEADFALKTREIRRKDTINFVTDLIGALDKHNAGITYDKESGKVFATNIDGKKTIALDLPKDTFKNGTFITEVGTLKTLSPVGLYDFKTGYDKPKELRVSSMLGKAVNQAGSIGYALDKGADQNDIEGTLGRYFRRMNAIMREASSASELDRMDWSNQFNFSYKDAIGHLGELYQEGYLKPDEMSGNEYQNVLMDAIEKSLDPNNPKPINPDNLDFDLRNAINKNINAIQYALARKYSGDYAPLLDNAIFEIKRSDKMQAAGVDTGEFYTEVGDRSRFANEAIARSYAFDTDYADYNMKRFGGGDVAYGRSVTYADIDAHNTAAEGLSKNRHIARVARLNTLAVQSEDISSIVALAKKNGWIKDYGSYNLLSILNTYEGSATMSGQVFDFIFNKHSSDQFVDAVRLADTPVDDKKTLIRQNKTMFRIEKSDDASSKNFFRYSNGAYIHAGDTIAYKEDNLSGEAKAEKAKYTGILKQGYFNDADILVDEDTINEYLDTASVKRQLAKKTEAEKQKIVQDLLDKKYKRKYYIENSTVNTHLKIAEDAEKGMTNALLVGLGGLYDPNSGDKSNVSYRIGKVAQELGLHRGQVLTFKNLEAFDVDNIADTTLGVLINGMRADKHKEALADKDIRDIIQQNGFKDAHEFFNAAVHERYKPTEDLDYIFHKMGALKEGQHLQMLSGHTLKGTIKHKDVWIANTLASNLFKKYQGNEDKVLEMMRPYLPSGAELKIDKHGSAQIIMTDRHVHDKVNNPIDVRSLFDLAKKEFGEDSPTTTTRNVDLGDGRTVTLSSAIHEYAQVPTYDLEKEKPMKVTYRHEANVLLGQAGRYEVTGKDNKRYALDGTMTWGQLADVGVNIGDNDRESSAWAVSGLVRKGLTDSLGERGEQIFQDYIAPKYNEETGKGSVVGQGIVNQIRRSVFMRAGDKAISTMAVDRNTGEVVARNVGDVKSEEEYLEKLKPVKRKAKVTEERLNDAGVPYKKTYTKTYYETPRLRGITKFIHDEGLTGESWVSHDENGEILKDENGNSNAAIRQIHSILDDAHQQGFKEVGDSALRDRLQLYNTTIAAGYNNRKAPTMTEKDLAREGFQKVSLDSIVTDAHGTAEMPTSMYGKNLLLDLHSDVLGDALYRDGGKRYVALPYVPARASENPDYQYSKSQYQKAVSNLVTHYKEYESDINGNGKTGTDVHPVPSEEERQRRIAQMQQNVQEVQDQIAGSLTDKNGIAAKAATGYVSHSARTLSHGLVYGDAWDDGFLSKLNFDGINLAAEHKKGEKALALDVALQSTNRMRKVYGQEFAELRRKGLSSDLIKELRRNVYTDVQKNGVEAIDIREPVQYAGSVGPTRLYFTDALNQDDATWHIAVGQEIQKEDNDSDQTSMAIQRYEAKMRIGNKNLALNVDSATYKGLSEMSKHHKDLSIELTEQGAQDYHDSLAMQYYNAAYRNKLYRPTEKPGFDNTMGDNSSERFTTEGKSYGREAFYSPEEHKRLTTLYDKMEDETRDYYDNLEGHSKGDFSKLENYEQRNIIAQHTNSQARGTSAEEVKNAVDRTAALSLHLQEELQDKTLSSAAGRGGAGIMNWNTQRFLRIALASRAFKDDELQNIMQVTTALQEGFLSPKNNNGEIDEEAMKINAHKMQIIGEGYQNLYHAAQYATDSSEVQDAVKDFHQVLVDNLINDDRMKKEFAKMPGMDIVTRDAEEAARKKGYESGGEEFNTFVRQRQERFVSKNLLQYAGSVAQMNLHGVDVKGLGFGTTMAKAGAADKDYSVGQDTASMLGEAETMANRILEKQGHEVAIRKSVPIREDVRKHQDTLDIEEKQREAQESRRRYEQAEAAQRSRHAERDFARDAAKAKTDVIRAARNMKLGGKGRMLVSIAGGLMLSGYTSSPSGPAPDQQQSVDQPIQTAQDPSSSQPMPATDQAAAQQSNMDQMLQMAGLEQPTQLSDSNLNAMKSGTKPTYVINVSANTPGGQQMASSALQSAVGGSVLNNASVNISMNTSFADKLSQLRLDQAVAHTLAGQQ